MKRFVTVLVLSALAMSAAAETDWTLPNIISRFRDRPDEAVQRIRYAVEELGIDVDGGVVDGQREDTPICRSPRLEITEELVRLGAIVRGRGDGSQTMLECAMYYGKNDQRLIDWAMQTEGINTLNDRGESPLCFAVRESGLSQVKMLLAAGADPNLHDESKPGTHPLACALHSPLKWNVVQQVLDMLVAAGAVMPEAN